MNLKCVTISWRSCFQFFGYIPRNGIAGSYGSSIFLNLLLFIYRLYLARCRILVPRLEKAMAPHSSPLAWKIPWMQEPGRLQSMGSLSQIRLSDFPFTFHFHALEKEMATHSSVLAWRVPETGEPGGLPSVGSHRVGHDWSDSAAAVLLSTAARSPWSGWVSALWTLSCYAPTSEPSGFASWLPCVLTFYDCTQCLLILACILFHLPAGAFMWLPEADPLTVICSSLLWALGVRFTLAWPLLPLPRSPAFTKAQISFERSEDENHLGIWCVFAYAFNLLGGR